MPGVVSSRAVTRQKQVNLGSNHSAPAPSTMDELGGGWERRSDGTWVKQSQRAHLRRRLRRALDAARLRFRDARRSGGGAIGKKGERVTVHEARLRSDSSALRDACVDAWRGFGLTDPSHERLLRRRAEQTLDIARVNGDGTTVTYLTFKLAMHRVAARHVAGLRLALADARAARGDDRGALREYRRALTEERAGWARTGRLEWAPASSLLNAARLTRVRARDQADLDDAEGLLRAAAESTEPGNLNLEDPEDRPGQVASVAAASRRAARHDLCVLLCQSDHRDDDAIEELRSMEYRYRLSEEVLRYDLDYGANVPRSARAREAAMAAHGKYVRAFDGAMPATALSHLRTVFGAESRFWTQHGYHEPGCGFFSYAHRLPPWNADDVGDAHPLRSTMDAVVRRVWRVAAAAFPRAREATAAEWWAHCRPHGSGHQLHFDSDDEGKGGVIRHPICSAIVFVTGDVGGPTLVTDQTGTSKRLASRGWLVEPRGGRVAVFDGRYLHGVIPGRGPSPRLPRNHPGRAAGFFPCGRSDCDARRITLMVAFWDEFAARPGGDGSDPRASFPKGSGRPFPDPKLYLGDRSRPKGIDWPEMFHAMHLTSMPDVVAEAAATRDDDDDEGGGGGGGGGGGKPERTGWVERCATPVGRVWQDVDEAENDACFPSLALEKISSVPPYDRCFMY